MVHYLAAATRSALTAPALAHLIPRSWRFAVRELVAPYHPERHYMRGPGPKWRAKHAYAAASERAHG